MPVLRALSQSSAISPIVRARTPVGSSSSAIAWREASRGDCTGDCEGVLARAPKRLWRGHFPMWQPRNQVFPIELQRTRMSHRRGPDRGHSLREGHNGHYQKIFARAPQTCACSRHSLRGSQTSRRYAAHSEKVAGLAAGSCAESVSNKQCCLTARCMAGSEVSFD